MQWVDYGKDFYTAVSWSDVPAEDGRRLRIGWLNNGLYAGGIPAVPWRSAQSVPRVLSLRSMGGAMTLVQRPVEELQHLRGRNITLGERALASGDHILITDVRGRTPEIVAEFDPGSAQEVDIKVDVGNGEETVIGYDTTCCCGKPPCVG